MDQPPDPRNAAVIERMRADFAHRTERPATTTVPERNGDQAWRTPDGNRIALVAVIGHTRPPQQDGVPLTAYYCEEERRYWVHEGGGISGYDVWYGPFNFVP
jgi:hypothetical protein